MALKYAGVPAVVVLVASLATVLAAQEPAGLAGAFDGARGAQPLSLHLPVPARMSSAPSSLDAKLSEAWRLLGETPTGKELLELAKKLRVGIVRDSDGWDRCWYSLSTNEILFTDAFVEKYAPEQLAYILAHELEHARQHSILGEIGYYPKEMELGALSVEARVWVELGAPIRDEYWKASSGGAFLKDHVLWLRYPQTVYFSWWLKMYPGSQMTLADAERGHNKKSDVDKVRAYWKLLQKEEDSWRTTWKKRLPDYPDEFIQEAFRGLMDPSLSSSRAGGIKPELAPGDYSVWLPKLLNDLPSMSTGDDRLLPSPPTPKDLQLLSYLGYEIAVYQLRTGSWHVRKGVENTVPMDDDLNGKLRVQVHNHPYFYQTDPLGKFPSKHDFYDDDADILFLATYEGLFRYKMPDYIQDPVSGQLFNPRTSTFRAFSDRILGESGPPYSGSLAQDAIKNPASFYRRLGMRVELTPWPQVVFPIVN